MFKDEDLNKKLRQARKTWRPKRKGSKFFKKVKKRLQVKARTGFEENYLICSAFKRDFISHKPPIKLRELKSLANHVIKKNKQPYEKRRKKKHSIRKRCWVCKDYAYYHHHIIQLMNGGYDNGINRIPICQECHEIIHPWLGTA